MSGDEFVYDEATGEWVSASAVKAPEPTEDAVVVRDSVGNILADGDAVKVAAQ